ADVERAIGRILVMPECLRGAGVDRPDVVRRSHVEDAVRQNRRSLDGRILVSLETPNLLERADILRCKLGQTGMPLTGVTAVKVEPAIGGRVEQILRIDALP